MVRGALTVFAVCDLAIAVVATSKTANSRIAKFAAAVALCIEGSRPAFVMRSL